jgi:hypothetical protein
VTQVAETCGRVIHCSCVHDKRNSRPCRRARHPRRARMPSRCSRSTLAAAGA